jgi:hypothetical protein
MPGYCTVTDVRDVFQDAVWNDPLDPATTDIVEDAIEGVRDVIERATKRHWYDKSGSISSPQSLIATSPNTRDDEHDLPRHGAQVHGESERRRRRQRENSDALLESGRRYDRRRRDRYRPKQDIRIAIGNPNDLVQPVDASTPTYTRITLARKDVIEVTELQIANADNSLTDWVSSNDYDGGVGKSHRGEDYWVQINSGGVSELYIDIHALDDDLATLSNAVYPTFDYGDDELTKNVRRAAAHMVASELVLDDEFLVAVPDNGQLTNVETKGQRWKKIAREKLEPDLEHPEWLME